MNPVDVKKALRRNRKWFCDSGVLGNCEGSWGVAERVLLTAHNDSVEKVLHATPAWSNFCGGCIIESRRPDCCFETAYYFLMLHELFHCGKDKRIAENILDYLYLRSGLLNRYENIYHVSEGVWNWTHLYWQPVIWFDDNAWCIILARAIAKLRPDLDRKYRMKHFALCGATGMVNAFEHAFNTGEDYPRWQGNLKLPHWGALAAGAIAVSRKDMDKEYSRKARQLTGQYFDYVMEHLTEFNPSELAYALLGAVLAERYDNAKKICRMLLATIDPETGCPPSSHYEAPAGEHLADLIYTVNWSSLALAAYLGHKSDAAAKKALTRMVELLTAIQDDCLDKHLAGCWRGMYDLDAGCWGGGDRFEGGGSSIYTGWTNAPLGWVLASSLGGKLPI